MEKNDQKWTVGLEVSIFGHFNHNICYLTIVWLPYQICVKILGVAGSVEKKDDLKRTVGSEVGVLGNFSLPKHTCLNV